MKNLSIQETVKELKLSKDKEDCLHRAYDILIKKYYGSRIKTITNFHYLFFFDIEKIWNKNGFLHCTKLNLLLKTLLIKSEFFKEDDIKLKWTITWLVSPHQYAQIKINDQKYINIDIWGYSQKIKFGDYAHGFR